MSAPSMLRPGVLIPFVVVTIVWGCTWIVIRNGLAIVPPTWSIAYRFGTAAVAMFLYVAWRRESLRLTVDQQAFCALIGFCQFVLNFNFVYRAEAYVTSGLVAVLFALLLVPNAIFGALLLRQPLRGRFLLGSIIAVSGVGLLILREARMDASTQSNTLWGVALTLLAVLSSSVSNVLQGTDRARAMPLGTMLAWAMSWGVMFNALLALVTVGWPVIDLSPSYIGGILFLGIMASAVAFACYFDIIRKVGPARAAYSGVITPVLAMLLSTAFESYVWSPLPAIGAALALVGLIIALSARSPVEKSG